MRPLFAIVVALYVAGPARGQVTVGEEGVADRDSVYARVDEPPVGIPTTREMMSRITRAIDGRSCANHPSLLVTMFIVTMGSVYQVELRESYQTPCEESVVRAVVREARFTAGRIAGKPVRVKLSIPFRFSR
jgi:hypothetical protein